MDTALMHLPEMDESIPEITFDAHGRVLLDGTLVENEMDSDSIDMDASNGGCGCAECKSNCGSHR